MPALNVILLKVMIWSWKVCASASVRTSFLIKRVWLLLCFFLGCLAVTKLSKQMLLNELLTDNVTFSSQAFINHQTSYNVPSSLAADLSDSSSSSCNLTSLNHRQSNKFSLTNDGELMKEKSKNAARSRREKENAEVIVIVVIWFVNYQKNLLRSQSSNLTLLILVCWTQQTATIAHRDHQPTGQSIDYKINNFLP